MMAFLDVRPGPSLNKTLAEMADRDGYEPVSIFFRAVADRRIGLTIVFSHRFAWTPRSIKTNLPRIVVISDSAHAPAWAAAIQPREIPCLLLRPPNGGVHPADAEAA